MLIDLPMAAVRYAALLNRAACAGADRRMRMVNWVRHAVGVYEQVGFDHLPWLTQWPHQKAIWALDDVDERLKLMRAQGYRADYGSADDIGQVLAHYPDLTTSQVPYLITFQTLTRADSPGWRWHKNGPYIGTRAPQCEHLGDEPDIDHVLTWDIWQVKLEPPALGGPWRPELGTWLTARMGGELVPEPVLLP